MPLSIIEAMAIGLPCIASNVGGVPELIEHGWILGLSLTLAILMNLFIPYEN